MTTTEYLKRILKSEKPSEEQLDELRGHRADVEEVLADAYGKKPTIRYAGSKAKHTMISSSYDLDIACYFERDDNSAGETLSAIYDDVYDVLSEEFYVDRKTSALRIHSSDRVDFHIDVVPGRFVDDSKEDVFIHQEGAEKCRLKTNLDVHVSHIKDSGVRDAIKLMKLWNVRHSVGIKTFVLELLVIDLLDDLESPSLAEQLEHVWVAMDEDTDDLHVTDPANANNDLTQALDDVRQSMRARARDALDAIADDRWEDIFGNPTDEDKDEALRTAAAGVRVATRPWSWGR
jgi:hypothetical protein